MPELTVPQTDERYHRYVTPISTSAVASFLGSSLALPFEKKQLVLVELAGPREHQIVIYFS